MCSKLDSSSLMGGGGGGSGLPLQALLSTGLNSCLWGRQAVAAPALQRVGGLAQQAQAHEGGRAHGAIVQAAHAAVGRSLCDAYSEKHVQTMLSRSS